MRQQECLAAAAPRTPSCLGPAGRTPRRPGTPLAFYHDDGVASGTSGAVADLSGEVWPHVDGCVMGSPCKPGSDTVPFMTTLGEHGPSTVSEWSLTANATGRVGEMAVWDLPRAFAIGETASWINTLNGPGRQHHGAGLACPSPGDPGEIEAA
jgi:hypothetical protein